MRRAFASALSHRQQREGALKMKAKDRVRLIGGLGIAVTSICLIAKAWYCIHSPFQERLDISLLLGLIVGFSFIHSAAIMELRNKIDNLEKRR
jgi:hypothetical protein